MPVQTRIQIRRGTTSEWTASVDPLSAGELGLNTTLNKFKVGNGSSLYDSLSWATMTGSDISGVSGIQASYNTTSGQSTLSVTGLSSSYLSDFNSSVSGLLPIKSLTEGTNITITPTGDKGFIISSSGIDANAVKDVIGASITGVSGIMASYDNSSKIETISITGLTSSYISDFSSTVNGLVSGVYAQLNGATFTGPVIIPSGSGNFNNLNVGNVAVSVSGHSHVSSDITNFNSSVSGLLNVKSLVASTGIGISNSGGVQTISVTGIPSSLITDLGNVATTEVIGRTGIQLTYDNVLDKMYIDATGVSFDGHSHVWSSITDASLKASLTELSYLSGVSAGTASASRVVVLDSSKNITGIGSISTTGNITVGGDLVVNGTTTTVNSTTVDIGDNIIRVNTSGLNTGGMEVYTGSDTKSLVWNTSANRWEFTGGNIYTSGSFIGSLSGNASTVTSGVYTSDTGTVTNSMLAGSIANNKLSYSSVTIGSTPLSLGGTATAFSGLTTVTATTFAGSLSGTADSVVTNANLTGPITSIGNATTIATGVIDNSHISATGAIAYSKLSLSNSVTNSDIATGAGIAVNKLASSGITFGSTATYLGGTASSFFGLTSISGTSAASPTTLYYCAIDGGTP